MVFITSVTPESLSPEQKISGWRRLLCPQGLGAEAQLFPQLPRWQWLSQPLCSGQAHLGLGPLVTAPLRHFSLGHPEEYSLASGLALHLLVCALLPPPLGTEEMLLKLMHCKYLVHFLCLLLNSGQSLQQCPKGEKDQSVSLLVTAGWRWTKAQVLFSPEQTVTSTKATAFLYCRPSKIKNIFIFFNSKLFLLVSEPCSMGILVCDVTDCCHCYLYANIAEGFFEGFVSPNAMSHLLW